MVKEIYFVRHGKWIFSENRFHDDGKKVLDAIIRAFEDVSIDLVLCNSARRCELTIDPLCSDNGIQPIFYEKEELSRSLIVDNEPTIVTVIVCYRFEEIDKMADFFNIDELKKKTTEECYRYIYHIALGDNDEWELIDEIDLEEYVE